MVQSEQKPELEEVLESDGQEPHSLPPEGIEPELCDEHGYALVHVEARYGGMFQVFECGCEVPL